MWEARKQIKMRMFITGMRSLTSKGMDTGPAALLYVKSKLPDLGNHNGVRVAFHEAAVNDMEVELRTHHATTLQLPYVM